MNKDGFWYSYKKRKDGKYDFEFYRYDKCISKGCAGSQATVMRLFRAQVKSTQI